MVKHISGQDIHAHVQKLLKCRACPLMHPPVVSGGPVASKVILVGQAPGDKEPKLGRPFAWTAGKTLFKWFNDGALLSEEKFRQRIYMAAVCRCFPGKNPAGGDRVPNPEEIRNCSSWLDQEINILKPDLIIPVGKLAIAQFLTEDFKLNDIIGKSFKTNRSGSSFDLIPLPHPSGASPWHRTDPGKGLVQKAMGLIAAHHAFKRIAK